MGTNDSSFGKQLNLRDPERPNCRRLECFERRPVSTICLILSATEFKAGSPRRLCYPLTPEGFANFQAMQSVRSLSTATMSTGPAKGRNCLLRRPGGRGALRT